MSNELKVTTQLDAKILEQVLIGGDLAKLSAEQRTLYYSKVCESLELNPLTKPFEYISLNGRLTLYARKDCTEQLRTIKGVSILDISDSVIEGVYVVTAKAQDGKGRTDASKGAVSIAGLKGESLANAMMKAETKAKRRVTLSICGLGMLDETEIDSIPTAKPFEPVKVASPIKEEVKVERKAEDAEVVTKPEGLSPKTLDKFMLIGNFLGTDYLPMLKEQGFTSTDEIKDEDTANKVLRALRIAYEAKMKKPQEVAK
jgi:hypothetical protein